MDTTYVNIMLIVFLCVVALAIDVGYLYVSDEDLQNAAETSALAGAKSIGQRVQTQIRSDPGKLNAVVADPVQSEARTAAIDKAHGKHAAASLVGISTNNGNKFSENNDMTVGFWNMSTHTYTPGGIPVNAMQVRTRRTAESESVGLGDVGSFFAKMTGTHESNYTPEAIAAIPARASANIAICADACDKACAFPAICTIPERKMVRDSSESGKNSRLADRYAYTSLLYGVTSNASLSDLICMEMPAQGVCGKEILTTKGPHDDGLLRDMQSMMYNPNIDASNKEYDKKTGKLLGWWVIAPVTACPPVNQEDAFERHTVARYALIRISRICATGEPGCRQNYTSFSAPSSTCSGESGLFIDRISSVGCGSRELLQFPGLHPVIVK